MRESCAVPSHLAAMKVNRMLKSKADIMFCVTCLYLLQYAYCFFHMSKYMYSVNSPYIILKPWIILSFFLFYLIWVGVMCNETLGLITSTLHLHKACNTLSKYLWIVWLEWEKWFAFKHIPSLCPRISKKILNCSSTFTKRESFSNSFYRILATNCKKVLRFILTISMHNVSDSSISLVK